MSKEYNQEFLKEYQKLSYDIILRSNKSFHQAVDHGRRPNMFSSKTKTSPQMDHTIQTNDYNSIAKQINKLESDSVLIIETKDKKELARTYAALIRRGSLINCQGLTLYCQKKKEGQKLKTLKK